MNKYKTLESYIKTRWGDFYPEDIDGILQAVAEDKNMKTYQAILSKTTKDDVKSKIKSTEYVELVLDVYMRPQEYAKFMEQYFEESFEIGLPSNDVSPVSPLNHPVETIVEGQK